jgi:hypothetical protein
MDFEEGTYRLSGGEWQVFIFSRRDVAEPQVKTGRWDSGVTGVWVKYPSAALLNRAAVERVLGAELGITEFVVVRGPDSMNLR